MADKFNNDSLCHKYTALSRGGSAAGSYGTGYLHTAVVGSMSQAYVYFGFSMSSPGTKVHAYYPSFGFRIYKNYSTSYTEGYCSANISDWNWQQYGPCIIGPTNFGYFLAANASGVTYETGYTYYKNGSGYPCSYSYQTTSNPTNFTVTQMANRTNFQACNKWAANNVTNQYNLGTVVHIKVNFYNILHRGNDNYASNRFLWVAKAGSPSSDYFYDASVGGNGASGNPAAWSQIAFTHEFVFGGGPRVWNGSTWKQTLPYVWNGSTWKPCMTYIYANSKWNPVGG